MDSKKLLENLERKSVPITEGGIHVEKKNDQQELLKRVMTVPNMQVQMPDQMQGKKKDPDQEKEKEKAKEAVKKAEDPKEKEEDVSSEAFLEGLNKQKNEKFREVVLDKLGSLDDIDDVLDFDEEGSIAEIIGIKEDHAQPVVATQTRLQRYGELPRLVEKNAIKAGALLKKSRNVVKRGNFSQEAINTGFEFIRKINEWAGIDEDPKGDQGAFYNKLGNKDTLDYLYVDGKPLKKFVEDQYGYKGSRNKAQEKGILSAYVAMIAARQNHPLTLVRPVIINGVADVDIRNVSVNMGPGRNREDNIRAIRNALKGEEYRKYCVDAYRADKLAEAGNALREVKGKNVNALKKLEALRAALYATDKGKHKEYDRFVRTFNTYFNALEFICLDPEHMDVNKADLTNLYRLNESAISYANAYLKGKKMNLGRHTAIRDLRDLLSSQSGAFWGVLKGGSLDEAGKTISLAEILDRKDEGFVVMGIEEEVSDLKRSKEGNAQDKNVYEKIDDEDIALSVRQKNIIKMKTKITLDPASIEAYRRLVASVNNENVDDDVRLGYAQVFIKAAASTLLTDEKYGSQIRTRYAYAGDNTELLLNLVARDQLTKAYKSEFDKMPVLQTALDIWNEQIASEEAEALSYKTNTLGDKVSRKEFKENGGSADHRYVSVAEANEIVASSRGFLCAKKVNGKENLREIRPSMPEFVTTLNGAQPEEPVMLRKAMKAMFKTAVYLLFDKKGKIKKDMGRYDLNDNHDTIPACVDNLFRVGAFKSKKDDTETFVVDVMLPAMTEMLKDEYKKKKMKNASDKAEEDAFKLCSDYVKLIRSSNGQFLQSPDVSFELFQLRTNIIRDTKIEDLLNDPGLKDLVIDGQKVTEEEIREAYDEVLKQTDKAEKDLKEVGDMDLEDEEMCAVSSCVDNAVLNAEVQDKFGQGGSEAYEYKYSSIVSRDPKGLVTFIKSNWDRLVAFSEIDEAKQQEYMDKLNNIEAKLNNNEKLNMSEKDALKSMISYSFGKYELHKVPLMGKVGNSSYTTETFGAPPEIAIQSPLTMHCKIGKYTSDKPVDDDKHEAVDKYYSHDDTFSHISSRKKIILSRLKEIINTKTVHAQNHVLDN